MATWWNDLHIEDPILICSLHENMAALASVKTIWQVLAHCLFDYNVGIFP